MKVPFEILMKILEIDLLKLYKNSQELNKNFSKFPLNILFMIYLLKNFKNL